MPGNKVVRYKRRPRAVAFIFALVLIYIICFFVLYTTKAKVQTYEVNVGSLTNNAVFTALAVGEERDRKSTRLNSSHRLESRMPSSA